jgi:hypothetical protein
MAVADGYNSNGGSFTDGSAVDTLGEVTALINLVSSPATPIDSDNDGMSDAWETGTFGNLSQAAAGDYDSDGYTNVEEYLFYLGGYSISSDTTPPAAPLGLSVS